MTRRERLEELYRRLAAAPQPVTAEESLELVCRILDEVEDELSGIPAAVLPPVPPVDDGRMYPPQGDNVIRLPGGGMLAKTKGHRIIIGLDGSIQIRSRLTDDVEFER